jgi:5-methylcytosine-specific restriction protein A
MSETFTQNMRRFFNADEGAFSVVTSDEHRKSQITFVGPEQELAERYFGRELDRRHGNKDVISALGLDPALPYRRYPSGRTIELTTSYKTNKPRELRYYLQRDVFKPDAGDYWGIFRRGRDLWICEFSRQLLEQIESGVFEGQHRNEILEPDEGIYQDESNQPSKSSSIVDAWKRDPKIAHLALTKAGFRCEMNPGWPTFVNRLTGKPHMEAHHLIPMSLQEQFKVSLDSVENICCLNPLSHRMLHHAAFTDIELPLVHLIRKRPSVLTKLGLLEDDVLAMYDR